MGVFLAIALIAYVLTRAVSDARIDHTYAKQGLVSPRLDAKYGSGAREKTARYGFADYLRDAWSDHWQRRAAALEADREVFLAHPGQRVRFRDRLARAKQVMATAGRTLVEPVRVKQAEPDEQVPVDLVPALAVDTGDVPPGTIRHTDTGREQWTGSEWVRVPQPSPRPRKVGERYTDEYNGRVMEWDGQAFTPVCSRCDVRMDDRDDHGWLICEWCDVRAVDDRPGTNWASSITSSKETPVSDQGYEATNFETAVPALNALTTAAQNLTDHVAGAKNAAAAFHDHVDEVDQARRAVEEAATAVMEQLAARNLDADTMGSVTSAMELIKAGDLSAAMDHIDAAAAKLAGAETAAQEASGAAAAASATVVSKYGDAASTVASELSGDASFLHSGGGAPAGVAGMTTVTTHSGQGRLNEAKAQLDGPPVHSLQVPPGMTAGDFYVGGVPAGPHRD